MTCNSLDWELAKKASELCVLPFISFIISMKFMLVGRMSSTWWKFCLRTYLILLVVFIFLLVCTFIHCVSHLFGLFGWLSVCLYTSHLIFSPKLSWSSEARLGTNHFYEILSTCFDIKHGHHKQSCFRLVGIKKYYSLPWNKWCL